MEKAVVAVENGMSIRKASELHGVPRSTLHDHVSGKVTSLCKPGPQPYLSTSKEEELVVFLLKCAKMGYPHTRQQILAIVQQILDHKGVAGSVTNGWWERFRKRNPSLTLRTAVPLSYVRAIAQDQFVIKRYYDLLEDTLVEHDLLNDPIRIFNCDETGLPLSPKPLKVICEVGTKNLSCITGDTKSQVSVLVCTSAAEYVLPPYVIFDRKTVHNFLTSNPGRTVSRYDFSSLFSQAWYAAINSRNVTAGFWFCGVYPLNKNIAFGIEDELKNQE